MHIQPGKKMQVVGATDNGNGANQINAAHSKTGRFWLLNSAKAEETFTLKE